MRVIGKSIWDYIAPIAGAALGSVVLPGIGTGLGASIGAGGGAAIGAGVGSGLATGVETGNPLAGLASGAASGLGSYAGGQLLGPSLNGLGGGVNAVSGAAEPGALGTSLSKTLGDTALSGIGDTFGSTTPGDILGSAAGSAVAQDATQAAVPGLFAAPTPQTPGFTPTRADPSALPGSLSSFSSLDPNQQATNIATKGVYGGGEGSQENQYFLNLINRQLVDQQGNVGDMSTLPQIDNSYLAQMGLGGDGNTNDLLKGISQYQG